MVSQRSFDDSSSERRFALSADLQQIMSLIINFKSFLNNTSRESRSTLEVKRNAGNRERGPGPDKTAPPSQDCHDEKEAETLSSLQTIHERSLGKVSRLTRSTVAGVKTNSVFVAGEATVADQFYCEKVVRAVLKNIGLDSLDVEQGGPDSRGDSHYRVQSRHHW